MRLAKGRFGKQADEWIRDEIGEMRNEGRIKFQVLNFKFNI